MLRSTLLIVLVVLGVRPEAALAQQAVFLVRHAEKVDDSRDPPLSPEGTRRAARLADMLADAGVTAIYATEFQRTRFTAQPLATRLGIGIETMPAGDPEAQIARLRAEHRDDRVLLVGHSNTLPELLSALDAARGITIDDAEYDNLFIVVPQPDGEPVFVRLRFE